jgi:hypothetical protein
VDTLNNLRPEYPKVDKAQRKELAEVRRQLEGEKKKDKS